MSRDVTGNDTMIYYLVKFSSSERQRCSQCFMSFLWISKLMCSLCHPLRTVLGVISNEFHSKRYEALLVRFFFVCFFCLLFLFWHISFKCVPVISPNNYSTAKYTIQPLTLHSFNIDLTLFHYDSPPQLSWKWVCAYFYPKKMLCAKYNNTVALSKKSQQFEHE